MNNDISRSIPYVGCDDTTLDLFEGQYIIPKGMSYNAWVILDEKTVLMDTVDGRCAAEWLEKTDRVLASHIPDYLVLHHAEPDHSAAVAEALRRWPGLTVVASQAAIKMLGQFNPDTDLTGRTLAVKEGDELDLGAHKLRFIAAPMVHWPEVMMSYESSERVLFSADGFGKFGAVCHEKEDDWVCEGRRYYFNICGKYGQQVQNVLRKISGLPIDVIASLHGPVLRGDIGKYVSLYDTWSSYRPERKGVALVYGSFHGGTAAAAHELSRLLSQRGVEVDAKDVSRDDMAEAVESAFEMSNLVVCAPTYDGGLMPGIYDFLHHLEIKNWQNRSISFVENGSWAPAAARLMQGMVSGMKDVKVVGPVVSIRSRLTEATRRSLEELADAIASSL